MSLGGVSQEDFYPGSTPYRCARNAVTAPLSLGLPTHLARAYYVLAITFAIPSYYLCYLSVSWARSFRPESRARVSSAP